MHFSAKIGAWGSLTVLLLVALAGCGLWIALTRDPALFLTQWIVVMAILLALCILAGVLVNGRPDGILIDDRNRISLERFQWVCWLILLLGGYFAEAVWNIAHAADLASGAVFPQMQNELFLLLGIVSVSPVISNVIVDSKKRTPEPAAGAAQLAAQQPLAANDPSARQTGVMDVNASVADASWADLYLGEEAANRYVVDISRLQKLVITVLLVFAYAASLWRLLEHPATSLSMPGVGNDFIGLLGISHGAYLAAKTTTKTPT
jgi:hypothetical protein